MQIIMAFFGSVATVENILDNTLFSKSFVLFLFWLENKNVYFRLNIQVDYHQNCF
jgi:hypothetical protein